MKNLKKLNIANQYAKLINIRSKNPQREYLKIQPSKKLSLIYEPTRVI